MTWDCKYKFGRDHCRKRKTICYPGGEYCVLKGKFVFPLRDDSDELSRMNNDEEAIEQNQENPENDIV